MKDLELFGLALAMVDREVDQEDLDSEYPSKEVRLCRRYLPSAITRALREFDWSFLTVKLTLDATKDVGGYAGYSHGYELPADLLKLVPMNPWYPYEVNAGRLYCDEEMPPAYGIFKTLPATGVPNDFMELIAYSLAYLMAPMLSPGGTLDQMILQRYTWVLSGLTTSECKNNSREPDNR